MFTRKLNLLFFSEIQTNRYTLEVKMLTQFILEVTHIGLLDVLRGIAEKRNRRRFRWKLCDVLDLYILSLVDGGRIIFYQR